MTATEPTATTSSTPAFDPETLKGLPPSAKLVIKVLEHHDTLTQRELADETLLPPRTVRYALRRLEDADIVAARFSFTDARKRLYYLNIA